MNTTIHTTAKPLAGKVAFIHGGSRGIGAAVARRLARDGASVAIGYASSAIAAEALVEDIKAGGGNALALKADATDAAALTRAIDGVADRFGRLDILVNSAGVLALAPLDQFTLEDFDRTVAVNIRSVFVATQAAALAMSDPSARIRWKWSADETAWAWAQLGRAHAWRLSNDAPSYFERALADRTLANAAYYIFVPALLFRTTARIDLAAMPWGTVIAFFVPVLTLLIGVYLWERRANRDGALPTAAPSVRAIGSSTT